MKRALVLCLFLAISGNIGECASPYFPPLQPVNGGQNIVSSAPADNIANNPPADFADTSGKSNYSMVSYPKIDQIEHSLFGHTFPKLDITTRLSRIEKSIFSTTYPNTPLAQRVDNILMNFNQINQYKNISKNVLSNMEAKVLQQTFPENDAETRVERLEQQVFGAVQSGDLTTRYSTLKMATSKYNVNRYGQNYEQTSLNGTQGGWRGVMGNLGSLLPCRNSGTMTGFTPPIDPLCTTCTPDYGNDVYNSYNGYSNGYNNYGGNYKKNYNNWANLGGLNRYGNSAYGSSSGYGLSRAYTEGFSNYGTGSRVTILD